MISPSAVRALKEATRIGADDALFVNERGQVQEATRSNFFLFHGDTLVTPRAGVLIGITRVVVLELALDRFTIEERPILLFLFATTLYQRSQVSAISSI